MSESAVYELQGYVGNFQTRISQMEKRIKELEGRVHGLEQELNDVRGKRPPTWDLVDFWDREEKRIARTAEEEKK